MPNELDLFQGTLDILVLRALSHGPMHGYAVARWIREGSDGTFRILDGALYTSLHRMDEKGWIDAEWGTSERGKRARFYELTPAGRAELQQRASRWDRYVSAVALVMAAPARA
ncbi:MAG: PadR family transcriptional regulator [Gemmatimonadales bacterium]|jgi:PadR family transcriptional regulator PadR|nr:MAG: PadR family transcriptional regulator [Gemmatimonadales bacterium]